MRPLGKQRLRRTLAALATAIFAVAGLSLAQTPAAADSIFTLYLSSTASDNNNGRTLSSAVRSLERVHYLLKNVYRPTVDVEVRIKQGTYIAKPFDDWSFYVPGHTVTFLPIDYQYGEGIDGIAGRPVFRNERNPNGLTFPHGYWMQTVVPSDPADPLHGGGTSGLRFYYLQVEYYSAGGVSIYGDQGDTTDNRYNPPLRIQANPGLNGNTIFGMLFIHLGDRWATGPVSGFGGVVLTNSSNNLIENNHFDFIENRGESSSGIHGVYVTHFSSSNRILRNSFVFNSGEPIKIRDRSNYNTMEYNVFTRAGVGSYYVEQFCDLQCAVDNEQSRQCASYHNRFFRNEQVSSYEGPIVTWALEPQGLTYPGHAPCTIPAGEFRLSTGFNT